MNSPLLDEPGKSWAFIKILQGLSLFICKNDFILSLKNTSNPNSYHLIK